MTHTQHRPMPTHHRIPRAKPELSREDEALLRDSLLMVTGALDARPCPSRDMWDALGRQKEEAEIRHPKWLSKTPEVLREALEAGRLEGQGSLAATVHRVRVFFAALEALTLKGYETPGLTDFESELVTLTEEAADVTVCASRALKEPSESNLEALRFAVMESAAEDEKVLDMATRRLTDARTQQLAYR